MLDLIFVGLLQAAAGEPQTAQPAQQAQTPTQPTVTIVESQPSQANVAPEDRIICRRVVRTGTRMAQRRCLTYSDQEEIRRLSQEVVENNQRLGLAR